MGKIEQRVHELYWNEDINCARTMLISLGELCGIALSEQVLQSAVGMHGAGGYRAQCGLVEGGLMFMGIYYHELGRSEEAVVSACYQYAEAFSRRFGSLRCYDLRPNGFTSEDPPHLCENLTCEAVTFTYEFMMHGV